MALSSPDAVAALGRLNSRLIAQQKRVVRDESYYGGEQKLRQLGLSIPPELRSFTTIVNWCRVVVDTLEHRCNLDGFVLPGQPDVDEELARIWQANDLDEGAQQAHTDTFVHGLAFACVGADEDDEDTPVVTVESPREMTADGNGRVLREALRRYRVPGDAVRETVEHATLYLPDETIWFTKTPTTRWAEVDRDEHDLGVVPVAVLRNRPRTGHWGGSSEMADARPIVDSAARALTNAQLATEILAVPQRYVLGSTKGDFVDKDGNQLSAWEAYLGAIWALGNPEAKAGQFAAADLSNFTRIGEHYAQIIAGLYGYPVRYFGMATANPPTEGSIVADETRLIKRAERATSTLSGGWELVQRLVMRFVQGEWDPALRQMETVWRNPATPTQAQTADASVKLFQAGVLPREEVWVKLGYTAAQREKLREQMEAERTDPELAALLKAPAPPAAEDPEGAPVS